MGGISRRSYKYDFSGNVLKEHESHEKESGATPDVLHRSYTYDVRHRLTSERNKLNDSEETIIKHIYNDLGQSVEKHYRCGDSVYTEKSSYTLQGWLKTLSGPYYSQTLRYYDPLQPGTRSSFNGNISEWEWSHGGSTVGYGYGYDHSNRLSQAVYSVKSNNVWTRTDQFTVKDIRYDLNGNLSGLIRHHNSATDVKSLDYIYAGPHLRQLKENGSFRSYCQYDKNGNMRCDGRNNCYFEYNYLNLLSREGSYNTFAYSSSGEKLSLLDEYRNGRMYLGSLSYTKSNKELLLEGAQFSDGMIMRSWYGGYDTHLYFRDHLGSVRVVLNTANNRILERNDYYPFGLRHSNSQTPVSDNRFRYNGKERHNFGGNDYHDYGARMYDPYSGRWLGVDPLAEKYHGLGGYVYCLNNPVNVIDPDGRDAVVIIFPDYKISAFGKQWSNLGHAGVLLIDNQTGITKYYEYGRYDKAEIGEVRQRTVSNVVIDKETGKPTTASMDKVMGEISTNAGKGGQIEGAYIESDNFKEMNDYAQSKKAENTNPDRKEYSIINNNCGTFATDVVKQDPDIKEQAPVIIDPRPNSVIKEYQGSFKSINYNPKTKKVEWE